MTSEVVPQKVTNESKLELEIESMAHGAHAVAHHDGLTVFVENACPGDELEATIYDHRKSFAYAELTELTKPSDLRLAEPPCKLHKICGGCQWQHISYAEQLELKRQNVIDFVRKANLSALVPTPMLVGDVIGMTSNKDADQGPWRYRNKITYPVDSKAQGRVVAGYYKRNTHELVNVKHCPVQYSVFDEIIEDLKELCTKYKITKPLLRHMALRANSDQSQILITLIIRESELDLTRQCDMKNIFRILMEKYPAIKGGCLNYNDLSTNVLFGNKTTVLMGEAIIEDQIGDVRYKLSPTSFFQINSTQFSKIIDVVLAHVSDIRLQNPSTAPKILDAYSGVGTISLPLAKANPDAHITGIEVLDAAVRNATANAELNQISNVEFKTGQVEEHIEEFVARAQFSGGDSALDLVIINPPRKGCTNKVLDALGKISAENIIYVSCNPATLTRDIKYLEDYGYKAAKIQPVDMFPHTYHVESVALLTSDRI